MPHVRLRRLGVSTAAVRWPERAKRDCSWLARCCSLHRLALRTQHDSQGEQGESMKYSLRITVAGILALGAMGTAAAQSTDGYHSVQVFPVVVDSTTFAQRVHFTTPYSYPVTLQVKHIAVQGMRQATAGSLSCPVVTIEPHHSHSV